MSTANHLILLVTGGAIGTTLRYLVFVLADKHFGRGFPWATLLVNLIGSFVIGFLWVIFEKSSMSPAARLFVFVGLLGSFTTFSTFAFDNMLLINQQGITPMLLNVLLNNIGGILLCFGGYHLAKVII